MKAVRLYGPRNVRLVNIAEPPPPGPGEVLLQIKTASLCGTDASQYQHATMIPLRAPHPASGHQGAVTLGHEVMGVVIAKGEDVPSLNVGDRVVPGSGWWCGACSSCRQGRINICEKYFLYGIHKDGGLAERALFPARMCVRVPDTCSDEAAALAQPTAVALHALSRANVSPGQSVALFGTGNIGGLLLAVLQAQGINVAPLIAVDLEASRLTVAQGFGATHLINTRECGDPVKRIQMIAEGGVDLAIEATGLPHLVNQALSATRRGGTLLQVGIPSHMVTLALDQAVLCEKTIVTTNGQICTTDLPQALHLLAHTDLARRLGTYTIPLEHFLEDGLLPLVERRSPGKVIITVA